MKQILKFFIVLYMRITNSSCKQKKSFIHLDFSHGKLNEKCILLDILLHFFFIIFFWQIPIEYGRFLWNFFIYFSFTVKYFTDPFIMVHWNDTKKKKYIKCAAFSMYLRYIVNMVSSVIYVNFSLHNPQRWKF